MKLMFAKRVNLILNLLLVYKNESNLIKNEWFKAVHACIYNYKLWVWEIGTGKDFGKLGWLEEVRVRAEQYVLNSKPPQLRLMNLNDSRRILDQSECYVRLWSHLAD